MTSPAATLDGGRYLLTCALREYDHAPDWDRPELCEDVDRVVEFLCGADVDAHGRYRHVDVLGDSPTAAQLLDRLRDFCRSPDRRPEDYLVVYVTGHGEILEDDDSHVILTRDTHPDDLLHHVVPTSELVRMALGRTVIQRLLLIIDTCYSGRGGEDVAREALRRIEVPASGPNGGVLVVAATRAFEQAGPGEFTKCLLRAADSLAVAGSAVPWLRFGALMNAVKNDPQKPPSQTAVWNSLAQTGDEPDFIPNRRYRPPLIDADLLEQDRTHLLEDQAQQTYAAFAPAARWFVGRQAALAELALWLGQTAGSRDLVVVTGDPGSGKTAVLGLLALVDDPDRAPSIPRIDLPEQLPIGSAAIDCVIHARTLTIAEIRNRIARAASSTAATTNELVSALQVRPRPLVVLIDSLDEAADPIGLVRTLLLPLIAATNGQLRLALGTRRPLLTNRLLRRAGPDRLTEIDLDSPDFADRDGINAYIRRILLSEDSLDSSYRPTGAYRNATEQVVTGVADAIATTAGNSFLLARILATTEATRSTPAAPDDPAWLQQLPPLAGDAMDRDLRLRLGEAAEQARRALLPLAYAQGAGLPWEDIWPQLASALTPGDPVTDDDLVWLRTAAGSYVIEGAAHGRSAYRLFHKTFAEHLLADRNQVADNATIVRLLRSKVPLGSAGRRDWSRANPYILDHFGAHAARAGLLDDALLEAGYLLAAHPPSLIDVLPDASSPDARRAAEAYARAASLVAASPLSLHVAALQVGASALADRLREITEPGSGWLPRWAAWQRPAPARTVGTLTGSASTLLTLDGTAGVLAVVCASGIVEVWDLERSVRISERAVDDFQSGCLCDWDGAEAVALGTGTGGVHVFTLPGLQPVLDADWEAHPCKVTALTATSDGSLLISGDEEGTIRVWSVPDRLLIAERENAHTLIRGMRAIVLAKQPLLVTCGDFAPLPGRPGDMPVMATWRLPELTAHVTVSDTSTLIFELDVLMHGDDARIFAYLSGETRVYLLRTDPAQLEQVAQIDGSASRIIQLDRTHAILCKHYSLVPLQLPDDPRAPYIEGAPVVVEDAWWSGPVTARGVPSFASAGRMLRLWSPDRLNEESTHRSEAGRPALDELAITALCHGSRAVHTGSGSGTLRSWDAATGRLLAIHSGPTGTEVAAVRTVRLVSGDEIVLCVDRHGNVTARSGDDGTPLWETQCGSRAYAADLLTLAGRPVLIVATEVRTRDHACVLLDAATGAEIDTSWKRWLGDDSRYRLAIQDYRRDKALQCVATRELAAGPVAAAGGSLPEIPVWSLETFDKLATLDVPLGDAITALGFGRGVLIAGSSRGILYGWSTHDWHPLWTIAWAHEGPIRGVRQGVWRTRDCLVTVGVDGMVRMWNTNGNPIASISIDERVLALDCSGDGRCVVGTASGVLAFAMR